MECIENENSLPRLDQEYWNERYCRNDTPWDLKGSSRVLIYLAKHYARQTDCILIPGAGSGHDLVELFKRGYRRTVALDWSAQAIEEIRCRCPDLPSENLLHADFFSHCGSYNLILEQTFFCALLPSLRASYVDQMVNLLPRGGVLAGVWFVFPLTNQGPPFGGEIDEYRKLFSPYFKFLRFEPCRLSVPERWGKEWLIVARKK